MCSAFTTQSLRFSDDALAYSVSQTNGFMTKGICINMLILNKKAYLERLPIRFQAGSEFVETRVNVLNNSTTRSKQIALRYQLNSPKRVKSPRFP